MHVCLPFLAHANAIVSSVFSRLAPSLRVRRRHFMYCYGYLFFCFVCLFCASAKRRDNQHEQKRPRGPNRNRYANTPAVSRFFIRKGRSADVFQRRDIVQQQQQQYKQTTAITRPVASFAQNIISSFYSFSPTTGTLQTVFARLRQRRYLT